MEWDQPPEILGLLSDPLRWQLVGELGRSDRRVGELVELVGRPSNLVSYHLAELRRAGVVSARRSSADGRDVYYRADLLVCRNLLGEAGQGLHPGLSVAPTTGGVTPRRAKTRLLFLCTGNSARSQIAEALVDHRSAGAVKARSAGSHPTSLHPNTVRVMAERGVDITDRPTKSLTRFTRERFDRRDHPVRQGARNLSRVPRSASSRALEHPRSGRHRRQRRGDVSRVSTCRRRDRCPGGAAAC